MKNVIYDFRNYDKRIMNFVTPTLNFFFHKVSGGGPYKPKRGAYPQYVPPLIRALLEHYFMKFVYFRGDKFATLKVQARAGDVLTQIPF